MIYVVFKFSHVTNLHFIVTTIDVKYLGSGFFSVVVSKKKTVNLLTTRTVIRTACSNVQGSEVKIEKAVLFKVTNNACFPPFLIGEDSRDPANEFQEG